MSPTRIGMLLALVATVPAAAHAQSGEMKGCYVPGSGSVYRVGVDGTPTACKSNHKAFSWTSGGMIFTARYGQLVSVSPGHLVNLTASCQPGEIVTGGGFDSYPTGIPLNINASVPSLQDPTVQKWWITAANHDDELSINVEAMAICAKPAS